MRSLPRRTLGVTLLLAGLGAIVLAGPLNPPAGPVASTYKTLTDVEPRTIVNAANTPGDNDATPSLFKITQPGSYYLTGNITGVAGKIGIEIIASGVTLDLGGFELAGVTGSLDAIRVGVWAEVCRNVEIRNGSIRGWTGSGLNAGSYYASNCIFSSLRVQACNSGIYTGYNTAVRDCVAMENANAGFRIGQGSTVSHCVARANDDDGFSLDVDTVVTDCSASYNDYSGFSAGGGGVTMTNCHASHNGSRGFTIYVTGAFVGASTLTGCTAKANTAEGFSASDGTTIVNCTSSSNQSHGIAVYGDCIVRNCTCEANRSDTDGAGISIQGAANRIEDNNCMSNRIGITVGGSNNFVARNTTRNNFSANFLIGSGNEVAPVITNPGTNGFVTMTPWSNVAY